MHRIGTSEDLPIIAKDIDIIFLCCSQNKDNIGVVNKTFLSHFKPGVILINIARGGLVNYEDVEEALQSGLLGGFGLDVYKTEPFPYMEDAIFSSKYENVVATPHVAGVTEVSYRTMANIMRDRIVAIKANRPFE